MKTTGVSYSSFLDNPLEKQLEDEQELEKNLNKDTKKKFVDEDAYDSEEEKKKKAEEAKVKAA